MTKNKKSTRLFKIHPDGEKSQFSLNVFNLLKEDPALPISAIGKRSGAPSEADEYINSYVKKDLLKISGAGKGEPVKFNNSYKNILGVGFDGDKCILTTMDLSGKTLDQEKIETGLLVKLKGKSKEIKEIIKKIDDKTKFKNTEFCCAGLAMPHVLKEKNAKSSDILAEGISQIFGCDVFITDQSVAAGYAEKEHGKGTYAKDILYMHSDIGAGVVIKGEMIFEADEGGAGGESAYLRPWNQFNIVTTAKSLVNKGLGTDIVNIVNGDVEAITLEVVLSAAEEKDELAEDLIKRSGLALGVRVAYLVNMFNSDTVILGGGTEKKEGRFIDFVKESSERFLLKNKIDGLKIIPGVLGEEASSVGAASLCRRELFMEV